MSCDEEIISDKTCPNAFCDDRLYDLPRTKRLRIVGASKGGNCFVEFPPDTKGFVIFDGQGAVVSEQPVVDIPVANAYATDPDSGAVLRDNNGNAIKGPHPGWLYQLIADAAGAQNRVQGLVGIPANVHWDGCKHVYKPTEKSGISEEDVPAFVRSCDVHDAVWKTRNICDPEKGNVTVWELGRATGPTVPYGAVTMFAGAAPDIPEGWLLCNGQSLSTTEYPLLFGAIGYVNGGTGAGFNVPDMRGMFVRGVDGGADNDPDRATRTSPRSGANAGDFVGSIQGDALQCHKHNPTTALDLSGSVTLGFESTATGSLEGEAAYGPDSNHGTTNVPVNFTNTDTEITEGNMEGCEGGKPIKTSLNETRPTNVNMNYIIHAGCSACIDC